MTHLLRIAALTAFLTLCMLLPFLPGRYDSLAVPLSMMAQLFGIVGLLLVPLGVVWIAYEYRSEGKRKRHVFAIVALVASSTVWFIVSLGAMFESVALGVAALGLATYVTLRLWPRVSAMRSEPAEGRAGAVSMLPLYLILVPAAVAIIRIALADPAAEFSRSRAIRNAAALIADLEQHRVANGRYPRSLVSVHPDYLPGVIGITQYRYEPSGDAYNVLFEQLSLRIGIKEIVMYNPRGEQAISSHALDVLQLSPEQLALDRTRGHNAVHDAPRPNWKFFWFD
ncbi:MAG: hypothetical protein ACREON_03560 [Gemmatimonadaceae bacterium]